MKYTKTGEYTYEDEDGITYDLSALDDLCDGMGGYLHFAASRGDEEAEIITNHSGEGHVDGDMDAIWPRLQAGRGDSPVSHPGH